MFKELTVEDWMHEIDLGLEYRRTYGMEDKWAQIEALAGNADPSLAGVGANIIYAMQDDLTSSLNVPNPQIIVDPLTSAEVDSAPVVEAVDNQLIDQLDMVNEVSLATNAAYLWGTAFLKIGFDSEFGWEPKYDFAGQQNPSGMTLTQIDTKQWAIEFNDFEPGMPWLKFCLPHDIVVPWGTRDVKTAPWIAHRVVRHVEDVRVDLKYSSRGLQPVMSMADWMKSYTTPVKPYRLGVDDFFKTEAFEGSAEYVEMWEIHDKRTGKIYVIATQHKKFLRNDKNLLQLNGLPFIELGFTPKTRSIWRTSDAQYLLYAQAELADIALQASKQRRVNVLKFLYNAGAIDDAELDKLSSAEVGVAIKVNGNQNINNAITSLPQPGNYSLYQEADYVRSNARETTGFTQTQAGEYAGARTTGQEVMQVQQARQTRMTRRQMAIANAYKDIFRKINPIIAKYWKLPRIIRTIGQEGVPAWSAFTGDQLGGRYSYRLTFEDSPFATSEQQQQMAMQAYQLAAQDPNMDPMAARRFLARSFRSPALGQIFNLQGLGGGPGAQGPGQAGQFPRAAGGGQGGNGANAGAPPQGAQRPAM